MTEHEIQKRFVAWFRRVFPGVLIFAIPNGGLRNKRTAALLKAEGATAGVPDLFIPAWGAWVEVKKPGGRVSPVQKEVMAALADAGYTCSVGWALEQLKDVATERARAHGVTPLTEEAGKAARLESYKLKRRAAKSS